MALPSRQITSINFADTFAHSLLGVAVRIKNVFHLLVEALITQRPPLGRYSRGLPHRQVTPTPRVASFRLSSLLIALASSGEPIKNKRGS